MIKIIVILMDIIKYLTFTHVSKYAPLLQLALLKANVDELDHNTRLRVY